MPLNTPLDQIDEIVLERLVLEGNVESKTIEYKLTLPGKSEGDRKDFLADVSSFANAAGGYLIYGMRAVDGQPVELCGLPEGTCGDAEVLALESSVRSGIAPRIPGVHSRAITMSRGRVVIVVRIPKSFASPHMVTYKGTSRFYSRSSNGRYQLDVGEIRTAFVLSESATDRCRDFRLDRLSKIEAGETPLPLQDGAKAVLHIVPVNFYGQRVGLDDSSVERLARAGALTPLYRSGFTTYRYNFEGVYTFMHPPSAPHATSYLQVFRSGCIETVDVPILERNKRIPSISFEDCIIKSLPNYFRGLQMLNVDPPVFVMLTLVGVLGFQMGIDNNGLDATAKINRNVLLCPEVLIEDFESEIDSAMKVAFDAVWNATGWPSSRNYQGNKWVRAK
jgi:hypothetical protein